eukprot:Transcript_24297.p2 GENE.Transcript_24297~~Transcript_24297.p2  ORF type:complete len:659 (+),score=143.51 Transcript_24297:4110-6086(+)
MAALQSSTQLMQEVQRKGDGQFLQISQLQSHMDRLEDMLYNGLSGLEAVFSQYDEVREFGYFELSFQSDSLKISYTGADGNPRPQLSGTSLVDFEHRLGFVQLDEKAAGRRISDFLQGVTELRKALAVMRELHALGQPEYQRTEVRHLKVDAPAEFPSVLALRSALSEWKHDLQKVSKDYPHLRFYSAAEAQALYSLLEQKSTLSEAARASSQAASSETTSSASPELEIALLMGPLHGSSNLQGLVSAVRGTDVTDLQQAGHAWPVVLGGFLSRVDAAVGNPSLPLRPPGAPPVAVPGLHLHIAPPSSDSVMRLLTNIYERLPEPFELLWCSKMTTILSIETFVKRMRENPDRCFAMVQVDALTPTAQQSLLRLLLSTRNTEQAQHNLHCIQSGPSILQAAVWMKQHKEPQLKRQDHEEERNWLKERALDGDTLRSVQYIIGDAGSGKTHQARKILKDWETLGMATGVISITEAFAPGVVAQQLKAIVLQHGCDCSYGFCFHINLGMFRLSERHQWDALMHSINRFFFGLLVLRSVEDPAGSRFNLPPGCRCEVLVEIPHRAGHLEEEEALGTKAGLLQELPVLYYTGTSIEPPKEFDVNDEVKLVCMYLKADKDGTIDHLYTRGEGGGPKVQTDLTSPARALGPVRTMTLCGASFRI